MPRLVRFSIEGADSSSASVHARAPGRPGTARPLAPAAEGGWLATLEPQELEIHREGFLPAEAIANPDGTSLLLAAPVRFVPAPVPAAPAGLIR
jgi:hypothetical protein